MVIKPGSAPTRAFNSLQRAALRILRRFGTDAHVYTAGANGAMVNLLQTGNYILSDGSTGYSAVDGPVGLVLDGAGSVGSELASTSSITLTGTNAYTALTMTSVSVGKTYRVSYDYNLSSGNLQFGAASSFTVGPAHSGPSSGTYTYFATGVGTNNLQIAYSNFAVGSVSNIVIKEVTGIHATQATTANKPTERRGLLNLALRSSAVNDAAWTKNGTCTTPSANTIGLPTDGDFLNNTTGYVTVVSSTYTMAVLLSGTGTVRIGSNSAGVTSTLVTLTSTPTLYAHNFTAGSVTSYILPAYRSGTSATSMTCDAIGLFTGTLTAQQILDSGGIPLTTSAAASNPNAGRYSWQFDGGDSLALGSVPFTQADDHAVICAVRNDTVTGVRSIFSVTGTVSQRVAQMYAIGTTTYVNWQDDAAADVTHSTSLAIGEIAILSCRKVGNTRVFRKNGVQVGTNTTALGTTTLSGANIGTSGGFFWNGLISQVLSLKGTFTDAEMLILEREAASTLPNAPSF